MQGPVTDKGSKDFAPSLFHTHAPMGTPLQGVSFSLQSDGPKGGRIRFFIVHV